MERVYMNGEHSSHIMNSMTKLWQENKYCDAVLEISKEKLQVKYTMGWVKPKSAFEHAQNAQIQIILPIHKVQWILITMTVFVPKDIDIKMNLLL